MSELTKEQVQAFIDDLAYIQAKHGMVVSGGMCGAAILIPDDGDCSVKAFSETEINEPCEVWDISRGTNFTHSKCGHIESIDPRKISGHQRMKFEEGLKRCNQ